MLVFSGEDAVPAPSRALFLGAEPHGLLKSWPEIRGWQPLKPKADAWEAAGFARLDEPSGKWPLVMVLPGKSRDETLLWFAMARDLLEPGGRIVAAMPNTAGAGRFEKELAKATGGVASLQKHKCRAFHAVDDGGWDESLFSEWRSLGGRRPLAGTEFVTEAGIFSADGIDPGSALLVEKLPAHLRGKVADLGAGWGFLTAAVLKLCPKVARVDLFEADARALECARLNLMKPTGGDPLELASSPCAMPDGRELHFHWHDVTRGLPEIYDTIVSNPPFHTGQATDVDLGRAFLKTACTSLRRGGSLWLVANRQLPYEPVLDSLGMTWRKVAEDKTYKVLAADKR